MVSHRGNSVALWWNLPPSFVYFHLSGSNKQRTEHGVKMGGRMVSSAGIRVVIPGFSLWMFVNIILQLWLKRTQSKSNLTVVAVQIYNVRSLHWSWAPLVCMSEYPCAIFSPFWIIIVWMLDKAHWEQVNETCRNKVLGVLKLSRKALHKYSPFWITLYLQCYSSNLSSWNNFCPFLLLLISVLYLSSCVWNLGKEELEMGLMLISWDHFHNVSSSWVE